MNFIALSFTLKEQPFDQIKPTLEYISKVMGAQVGLCCLVHGFMPKDVVLSKGFSTEVVDTLKELFPIQINCYDEAGPKRDVMASLIKEHKGVAFAIGDIKEGVLEEVKMYEEVGMFAGILPLNMSGENAVLPKRPLTFGEKAVGLKFNPGGHQSVDAIKRQCANAIDELNDQREIAKQQNNGEKIAQFTLAIRDLQYGQMMGVKAATWEY